MPASAVKGRLCAAGTTRRVWTESPDSRGKDPFKGADEPFAESVAAPPPPVVEELEGECGLIEELSYRFELALWMSSSLGLGLLDAML